MKGVTRNISLLITNEQIFTFSRERALYKIPNGMYSFFSRAWKLDAHFLSWKIIFVSFISENVFIHLILIWVWSGLLGIHSSQCWDNIHVCVYSFQLRIKQKWLTLRTEQIKFPLSGLYPMSECFRYII